MKIAVLIKSVPDTASVLKLEGNNTFVMTDELEHIVNPYDEFALEEAVRLKEAFGGEVTVVSMGNEQVVKSIRHALAVGADSAIWVRVSGPIRFTSRSTAKILASVIRRLKPDVIFAGKQAVDDDSAQIPERVAELLALPHVSAVTRFSLKGQKVTVDRQVEGGYYTIETTLPALFTTEKGLNVPRYPKLPDILKAKRKMVEELAPEDLNFQPCDLDPGVEISSMALQKQTRSSKLLDGVPHEQVGQLIPVLMSEGIL